MAKHELVLFPSSSTSSYASEIDFKVAQSSKVHFKTEGFLRTQKKKIARQKGRKMEQHRYVFETWSQIDILDDGYKWRKYGEKRVKNNKFSRSYYRCSYQGCNVKKQIQRHSKDEQIVVTTYDGMHTHPVEKFTESFEQILRNFNIYNNFYNVQR
ncbi:unnamed protein product [Lupinus luteus]|uniref:WRKY domain-containing protein n=1 Tax=Lupinus luteus TaxID=3873 RepID=A0AAV1WBK8_LUPLU